MSAMVPAGVSNCDYRHPPSTMKPNDVPGCTALDRARETPYRSTRSSGPIIDLALAGGTIVAWIYPEPTFAWLWNRSWTPGALPRTCGNHQDGKRDHDQHLAAMSTTVRRASSCAGFA